MPFSRHVLTCFVAMLLCGQYGLQAAEPRFRQPMNVLDHRGTVHSFSSESDRAARVFVFMTGECPISRSYVPTLRRLAQEWGQGAGAVAIYGVWGDSTSKPEAIAKFAQEYQIDFPVLMDRDFALADQLGPQFVPEAFVVNSQGDVVYRGRIDDTYTDLGRRRPAATVNDLADAVSATVAGKPVPVAETKAIGCYYERLGAESSSEADITYTRDVAPILFANCVVCHREGEIGPFSLTTYEDAAKRARQIAHVVERRLMPPWSPAEIHGEFKNQRTLTEQQIKTLTRWADTGRMEGDPKDLPPVPQFASGWRLGPPDLILEMPESFEVPADGPDIYQNFVIPVDIPEDKLVAGVQFVPGNAKVVHHSLLYLDSQGQARKLDAKTPEPGYVTFGGPGFIPTGSIGGWSPGKSPQRFPAGYGQSLKQHSDLVMQVHYHPTGKVEADRSKVAIYFVEKPEHATAGIWVSSHEHDIPPGETDYRLKNSFTLPCDVTMFGVIPHMHLLGHTMKAVAILPDGTPRTLVDVQRWDFNWQDDYRFSTPLRLEKGTRLEVEASYDNSADNPSNPNSPPARVTWGEGTTDEMFYCFFLVAPDDPTQLRPLLRDVLMAEIANRAKAKAAGMLKAAKGD
ncbi:MAG: redoxin domain-containing protein [Pirellulales bacterium]